MSLRFAGYAALFGMPALLPLLLERALPFVSAAIAAFQSP